MSCLSVSSPGGLLIPPNFPREILGGKRVPAVGAGPRGPRPRPQGPPCGPLPWPPELPALPWPPEPLAKPWPPELPAPPWPPELPAPPWPPEPLAKPWPPELPALPWPPEPLAKPWPPELPAPPWPPELPAPPWPPLSVCSTLEGPRPVFLSMSVLRGLQSAPAPPVELLRRGTRLPGGGSYVRVLFCVSSVPASCVHIWFVSCPCFMSL